MSVLMGSDLFFGMRADMAGVSRILVDTDVVWERQSEALLIYDGGSALEHGTPTPGYLDFEFGYNAFQSGAEFFASDEYAYISNGNINIDGTGIAGAYTEVMLGAYAIGVNLTGYRRLHITVSDLSLDPILAYWSTPKVQITDTAGEEYTQEQLTPNGFPYRQPLITNVGIYTFDVSDLTGIKYIRLLGRMSVSKIWLDNEEE